MPQPGRDGKEEYYASISGPENKNLVCKIADYVDYTGTKRQRKKRGFKLQREAKESGKEFSGNAAGRSDYDI